MKTLTLVLSLVLATCVSAFSQVPTGIKYQGVARNAFGDVMSEQSIRLRFTVIDSASGGVSVFSEMHTVETTKLGLFSLLVGKGDKISGDYENIAWVTGGKWLKIEMDPTGGTNFFTMGMSEMQSVPYAAVAATSISDPSATNEVITDFSFNAATNQLSVTEAGETKTVTINEEADDLSNNTLTQLSDVDAVPMNGHVLKWNGNKWTSSPDETNDQTLFLDDNELSISGGNSVDLSEYLDNTDNQQLFLNPTQNLILIQNGGSIDVSPLVNKGVNVSMSFDTVTNLLTITDGTGSMSAVIDINDHDNDSNSFNEIQFLSLTGNLLSISNGNSVTLMDNSATNELQSLSISGSTLSISNGNSVTLSDNSSTNELITNFALNGNMLQVTDAGGTSAVDLSGFVNDADSDPANEMQNISLTGNTLAISGGNSVTLSDNNPTNEIQSLSLSGNTISISGGNSVTITNNDNDATNELNTGVILSGTNLQISDAGGTMSVDLGALINDADANPANELNTNVVLNGNTLEITDAGGVKSVNLSALINDADANPTNELQTLSFSNDSLSISSGNAIDLSGYMDNTDAQMLNVAGTDLSISNGNTVDMSAFMDNTDAQTLTYSNDTLSIANGNSVVITDNDAQTLGVAGTDLSISNGNTVNMSAFMDNTDAQTISILNDSLAISGGNMVDLSSYLDNTDGQNLSLGGNTLSISGGNSVDLSVYLDDTDTDAQTLTYSNDTLSISNGNSVVIEAADEQTLSVAGTDLSISNGNTVNMSSFMDNTDAQTLSLGGGNLSISGGNAVSMSSFVQTGTTAGGDLTGTYPNPTINTGAVTSTKILDGTIVAGDIATDAVTSVKILDGTIATGDLATDAVTTAKILDLNVTTNKLAHASVTTAKILDGNVTDTKIAIDAIATPKIQNSAVTTAKINDGAVTSVKLGSGLTLAGTTTFSGNTDMGTNKITNLGAPTVGSDAATKTYVDVASAAQTLSIGGNNLSISGGNSVSLAAYLDNTDAQNLSFSNDTLTISGGNSVVVTANDDQTLSLGGNNLSIQNGNSVSLAGYLDNTDAQTLLLGGNNLSVSGGNSVSLAGYLDNTDAQTISLSNDTLYIAGGNNVVMSSVDDQTLTLVGNTLSIADGNSVVLTDNSTTNELITSVTMVSDSLKIIDAGGTRTVGKFIMSGTAAGGSLTGTYPNPTLVTGAVTQTKIQSNAVTTDKIMDRNVQSADLDTNLTLIGQTFVNGSLGYKIKSVTSVDDPYTVGDEVIILVDVTLGAMQVRLPAAASVPNRVYTIKKVDASGNAVTINPDGSETIDGAFTPTLNAMYDFIKVISTGTTWYIIGE